MGCPMNEQDVLALILDLTRSRHFGKYRGTVVSNADEEGRCRLKVKVPAVLKQEAVWALPCVPYAGDGVGFVSLPPEGAGVWVEFEGGDPSFPVWTGCFWADGEAPENGLASVKVWKTDKATIRIDDGGDEIVVENSSQARVALADSVVSEAGRARHSVGSAGVVSEQGAGKVQVTVATVSVNNGALVVV